MPNSKQLKQSSNEELKAQLQDLRRDLFKVRNERALSKKVEKPHRLRSLRKDIARIHTLLTERDLSSEPRG